MRTLVLATALLALAGCTEPYATRLPGTIPSANICYNGLDASPAQVKEVARRTCAAQGMKVSAFSMSEFAPLTCDPVNASLVSYRCGYVTQKK